MRVEVGAKRQSSSQSAWQNRFLTRHGLNVSYLESAQYWFAPVVESLVAHHNSAGRTLVFGVNGSQGSGKSTLCDYLRATLHHEYALSAISLSLDDFYLTRAQRREMAASVHPLFLTRGVPGTHDIQLLTATLDRLSSADTRQPVRVPRFDKAADDRRPQSEWDEIDRAPAVVLLEGWCLGVPPQSDAELDAPINELEREEDPLGQWRRYANDALAQEFPPLHERVDRWLMLQAPSFECVYRWRLEQEAKLAARLGGKTGTHLMDEAELRRFVQLFERLTRHCLNTLPGRVDHLFTLDEERAIRGYREREGFSP